MRKKKSKKAKNQTKGKNQSLFLLLAFLCSGIAFCLSSLFGPSITNFLYAINLSHRWDGRVCGGLVLCALIGVEVVGFTYGAKFCFDRLEKDK